MKIAILATITAYVLALSGCTNADLSSMQSWGANHRVRQYSGGVMVGQWEAKGKIQNEGQSDGYYFQDAKTGQPVMVSGTLQITIMADGEKLP